MRRALRPGWSLRIRRHEHGSNRESGSSSAAPTSFGPLSYSIHSTQSAIRAAIDVPARAPRTLRLRLRTPRGSRITGVEVDGRPYARFDARTGTIELPAQPGRIRLAAHIDGGG